MATLQESDPVIPYATSQYYGKRASACSVMYLLSLLHNLDEDHPFTDELRDHLASREGEVRAAMADLGKTLSEEQLQTSV